LLKPLGRRHSQAKLHNARLLAFIFEQVGHGTDQRKGHLLQFPAGQTLQHA
jgi:hypothetical protein